MKHKFILDENILYFAIFNIDCKDREDDSAAKLIYLIASNCHRIIMDPIIKKRYYKHLKRIQTQSAGKIVNHEVVRLILQILKNSDKIEESYSESPTIDCEGEFPQEDLHIVRIASFFHSPIITETVH